MSQHNTTPLKTTWEAAFDDIRGSQNPGLAVRLVLKSTVNGIPSGFYPGIEDRLLPTYKGHNHGSEFTVRELGHVYTVTQSGNNRPPELSSSQSSLFAPNELQSGVNLTDKSLSRSSADTQNHLGLSPGQKLAGGALLLYGAYKGLEALASAGTFPQVSSSFSGRNTGRSLPRLARAANRLEDKQHNIFVSHSWEYDEHYERIVDFLDEVPSLEWQNHSVPSTDPLPVDTESALRSELRNQMKKAAVVVVSTGLYGAHSTWIPEELELADELGKPVIAMIPEGQSKVPTKIQKVADTQVGWRKASLVEALAAYA
jgi:hypothetical protein